MENLRSTYRIKILGELEVYAEDDTPVPLASNRTMRHLLVALALRAGQPRRPEDLIRAVWSSGDASGHGRRSLEAPIRRLRGTGLPIPRRRGNPTGYRLDLPRQAVDALDFLNTVRAERLGTTEITRLLEMWRGDPRAIFDELEPGEFTALTRGLERFVGHVRKLPDYERRQLGPAWESFAEIFPDLTADLLMPGSAAVRQRRLLIVENEVNVAKMLASILYDYQTTIAVNLGEAMRVVTEQLDEIDGALIDLHLTERLDSAGLEVLSYIRDRRPELPRMLITASPPAGSQEQMRRVYGIIDTLVKGADGYSAAGVRDVVNRMFNESPEAARERSRAILESHAIKVRRHLMQRVVAARRGIRSGERSSYQDLERRAGLLEDFERHTDDLRLRISQAAVDELTLMTDRYVDSWPLDGYDTGAA